MPPDQSMAEFMQNYGAKDDGDNRRSPPRADGEAFGLLGNAHE